MFMSKQRATSWLGLRPCRSREFLRNGGRRPVGGGSSFGSRGSRTYSSPPATNTAPSFAPVEKSFTQPSKPAAAPAPMNGASHFGGWRSILLGGLFAGIPRSEEHTSELQSLR